MGNERDHQSKHPTFEEITRQAQETLLAQGHHVPTLILDGEQGTLAIRLDDVPDTHAERVQQMFVVGFAVAQSEALGPLQQVFFITEAWMSHTEDGQLPAVPPAQDPNRREILLVSDLHVPEGRMQMAVVELLRDPQGILRELKPFSPEGGSEEQVDSPLLRALAAGYRQGSVWSADDQEGPLV